MFKRLSILNAAELTVMSFFIASVIGAFALMFTERNRNVEIHKPELVNVTIDSKFSEILGTDKNYTFPISEQHVFTKTEISKGISFVDAWFTSISALCVTGLTSVDFSEFTIYGQIVTLLLIQMGGLGIIVFTSVFAFAALKGLSERISFKRLLANVMDTNHDVVRDMLSYVAAYTLIFQLTGFFILGIHLNGAEPEKLEGHNPWWWAFFHSVSAFNNAGFGLNSNNLSNFSTDLVVNSVISILIILGGIGYPVLIAFYFFIKKFLHSRRRALKNISIDVHSAASNVQIKIAIVGTIILLIAGTLAIALLEWNNPILDNYSGANKLLVAFFHSVSSRTAGFNTVDLGAFHVFSLIFISILMFIGANPAGTAGGIKIPTVAVLYGYIKDWFRAPGLPVELMGRKISKFAVSHAIRLFFFSTFFILVIILGISFFEREYLITPDPLFNLTKVIFESVSAFGTVGLSMGYSGGVTSFAGILSEASKVLLIITMFFGRIGPLTILSALPWKRIHENAPLSIDYENADKMQIG